MERIEPIRVDRSVRPVVELARLSPLEREEEKERRQQQRRRRRRAAQPPAERHEGLDIRV